MRSTLRCLALSAPLALLAACADEPDPIELETDDTGATDTGAPLGDLELPDDTPPAFDDEIPSGGCAVTSHLTDGESLWYLGYRIEDGLGRTTYQEVNSDHDEKSDIYAGYRYVDDSERVSHSFRSDDGDLEIDRWVRTAWLGERRAWEIEDDPYDGVDDLIVEYLYDTDGTWLGTTEDAGLDGTIDASTTYVWEDEGYTFSADEDGDGEPDELRYAYTVAPVSDEAASAQRIDVDDGADGELDWSYYLEVDDQGRIMLLQADWDLAGDAEFEQAYGYLEHDAYGDDQDRVDWETYVNRDYDGTVAYEEFMSHSYDDDGHLVQVDVDVMADGSIDHYERHVWDCPE